MAADSILAVTGHFPPSRGGVEVFSAELSSELSRRTNVVVVAPDAPGAAAVDRAMPAQVIRFPPGEHRSPRFAARVRDLARVHQPGTVWLTSGMPLGRLAGPLRRAGVERIVVSTHGMEAGWASVPPAAAVIRNVLRNVDLLTYLGEEMRRSLSPALPPGLATARLAGGVDTQRFSPEAQDDGLADRLGLAGRPVVVTASRLVTRKGQDVLLAGWPDVLRRHPRAVLLIIGSGPTGRALRARARRQRLGDSVVFAGSVPEAELAAHLALGDVFALPCRDVWGGLQREGLGLSILEASATGLPVVIGRSGGSPDAVIDDVTGHLVDGVDRDAVVTAVNGLLDDPARARSMGAAGRRWTQEQWTWEAAATALWEQVRPRERYPV